MTHVRIIAEIGINHDGSAAVARQLIDAAVQAGVWGVKFQYRNLDRAYAADSRQIGDEILQREIRRVFLTPATLVELTHYAQTAGLAVGISFFIPDDIKDFGNDIAAFDFFKVPSAEMTNLPLIRAIEALGKANLISTGAYAEDQVARILSLLDRGRWTPLHCVSNYPVAIANPRLGYLHHLQELWGGPVGYSSHDEYWETCLLALQAGATILERHITLNKAGNGLDHSSSSTPEEFDKLAAFARDLPLILAGDGPRRPNQGELLNLQNLGRSFYATSDIALGEPITIDKLILRGPRTGLGQEEIESLLGKPAAKRVTSGAVVDRAAFEPPATLPESVLGFAKRHRLSLPVRFHDIQQIEARIPVGNFEFHLTFGDIERLIDAKTLNAANRYTVHLPDYVNPTELMDPFSPDARHRESSRRALARTVDFARALQDRTGAETFIVGSFSVVHKNLSEFFTQHAELLNDYRAQGITILPQWLPPVAWYFGGAVRLTAMNNVADAAEIKRRALPICMDVCHLCMGDKVFDFAAADIIQDLAPLIRHIHLADAAGYDGEGVLFGEGDPENRDAIRAAMAFDCAKVIEVWQGHLNAGSGFIAALTSLKELCDG